MLVVLGGWRVWQANFASSAIAPSQIKSTAPVFDSLLTNVHETDQRLAQRVDTPGPAHAIGLPLQSIHPESSRARAIAELAGPPAARPLFFHSNPWAYLFINGDSLGMTPVAHALWAGGHEVALKHPRFPPLVFRLHVDARTPDTLLFSLWKQVGQLELHVTPWAEVFVNGQKRDFPPGSNTLLLLPGKHDLRFVHGELGEKTEQVYLQPGEVRRLDINMF
jgi:hypothetical protein